MPSSSSKKKRVLSAFDHVESLESEDRVAAKLRKKRSDKDVSRAKAAKSQTKIYSHLVETRILVQRNLQQATTSTNEDDSVPTECDQLLEQLLTARRTLMGWERKEDDDSDETLQSEYEICRDGWKEVLNRRHQDLRLHSGLASASQQFKVMDSSFWQQVEATVAHDEIRQQTTTTSSSTDFDDSKVYQQMLKEFVVANNNNNDNDNDTNQRWKTQNKKNQVDRKASKGRKIRYVEIPKLVNFCFPVSKSKQFCKTNLTDDEWFGSLFGGAWNSNNNNNTKKQDN
ncbi:apoptosis antagonizing transcription factor [Seminavis robusta]|uniref:Apoptosis antagonizing transcription factor n=1 Tax=Seminavis robusta TaxID=568900 RepID=A0A9N8DAF9_9STRA|nr:apoptosis antagonizing transcription factor [Seminavis robusta]|eukprot:Sro11_g008700.1 apoptosis antagonizing transcription factor (285) ;mRNA; r:124331-125185